MNSFWTKGKYMQKRHYVLEDRDSFVCFDYLKKDKLKQKIKAPKMPGKHCLDTCDGCYQDRNCKYQSWALGQ